MAVKCILTGQTPSVLDGVTENVQTQLNDKVDKVTGKGLSTNDYTSAEKTKLSGIETGAQKNTITGVKGNAETTYRKGNVNITATNIGLGNVNNTSDAEKPISNATQAALNAKQSKITANGILKGDGSGGVSAAVKGTDYDTEIGIVHYEDSFDSVEAAYNKSKRLFCSENPADFVGTDSDKLYALLNRSQPYFSDGKVEITYTFTCLDKTITLTRTKRNSTATPVDTWAKGSQAFNPRLHASTHKTGGGDAIAPSDIGAQTKIKANGVLKGDGSGNISVATAADIPGLSGKQATITGAATTITANNLTANRALISNSSGKVEVSAVTSTELGYLDGVTSNIQTQLNNKLSSAPVTSVNNKTGAVSLVAKDVGAQPSITANGILKGDGSGNITAASETEVELVSLPNICNPNLLDNWYFGNPVNQRGKTSYTGDGYTIDRWCTVYSTTSTVQLSKDGLKLDASSVAGQTAGFLQRIDSANIVKEQELTLSVLSKNGCNSLTLSINDAVEFDGPDVYLGDGWFFDLYKGSSDQYYQVRFFTTTGGNLSNNPILAVKLELGSQQTLAHQENGKWALNEIPDYGEQLARCQRYQQWLPVAQSTNAFGTGVAFSSTSIRMSIQLATPMRAKPSIEYVVGDVSQMVLVGNGTSIVPTNVIVELNDAYMPSFLFTVKNAAEYELYCVFRGQSSLRCLLNANL